MLVLLVGLWWHSQEDGGFGISGDLFDRSPESDRDPSLPADEESGTAAAGGDADGESIATTPDGPDALQQGIEPLAAPPVVDPRRPAPDRKVHSSPRRRSSRIPPSATGNPLRLPATLLPAKASRPKPYRRMPGAEDAPDAARSAAADTVPEAGESASTSQTVQATTGDIPPVEAAGASAPVAVGGEVSATQEAQPEAVAGIDRAAEAGTGDGNVPIPERPGAADPADEAAGASLANAPATDRSDPGSRDASTTAAGTTRPGLVLEFVHESWVEVYDRERARLYFNLVQPGSVLDFDGPRPFDVLLGYGKDVRVTIDGQAFDHTPFLKHGVARFSVGSESAGGTNVAESGR